ncbi:PIN domain-containing protein [Rhodoblastus acidophilus]|uniref:Ribonuclease VapC n=1 Tax=Rhodoblastus acidophilus TaxID=1074 RepID=A0A6N8DKY2_RHOAC|nr:type II toxin-antitoxin system VapC family toxin [Rhodoblastus acidophilus]MCW2274315.1 putative nucleic acid-binding protein [Rhodoblastus acidophilus]MTV31232.1 PIN domain-containing protein [Rhodoblastus acidophilus]
MLAIDTNIIVRLLTNDDPDQAARAKKFFGEAEVFVATTVLLETEWVLRGAYGFEKRDVLAALRAFAGLATVHFEDPARAEAALTLAEGGLDFADALHLAAAGGCDAFITFDKKAFAKAAPAAVREP